jgi:hypothetical protein
VPSWARLSEQFEAIRLLGAELMLLSKQARQGRTGEAGKLPPASDKRDHDSHFGRRSTRCSHKGQVRHLGFEDLGRGRNVQCSMYV